MNWPKLLESGFDGLSMPVNFMLINTARDVVHSLVSRGCFDKYDLTIIETGDRH